MLTQVNIYGSIFLSNALSDIVSKQTVSSIKKHFFLSVFHYHNIWSEIRDDRLPRVLEEVGAIVWTIREICY